jgi:hypothetical protein
MKDTCMLFGKYCGSLLYGEMAVRYGQKIISRGKRGSIEDRA